MGEDDCLFISMPNSESWLWKLWSKENRNPYFNSIEHYHNVIKTRLVSLLNACGFNIKQYGVRHVIVAAWKLLLKEIRKNFIFRQY